MSELWIIEAPGKARILEGILARLGIDARVQATKGHLLQMPDRLEPIGIDARLRDFMREPRDMDLYRRIREMARAAGRVVVATDADGEGDVIAWDVAEAIADIHPHPVRVRLKGMDDESVREAVDGAGPVRKEEAIAGRARAIVDRLIGAVFSRDGVAVGRVGTAMLGVVARDAPTVWRLNLSAPAKDGGRPWLAQADVKPPLTIGIAERLARIDLPALGAKASAPYTAPPANMGEIMIRASERLEISPSETARAMQRSYESGRLSYPRAGSSGMSRSAARRMRRVLERAGYRWDDAAVAGKAGEEVHDAPHPLGSVDVSLDPRRLGADEGVRTMIARDLVRCGQRHVRETALTDRLEVFLREQGFAPDVARHVAGLDWRREQGPRYPGQESWAEPGVVRRRPDAVLMEAMLRTGLGRPSTWASHVEGFLGRGLVDDELRLTGKGRAWLASSPPELADPRLSVAIERACERIHPAIHADPAREPWEALAERILGALPPSLREPVARAVAAEAPRPRRDFRALAEPGIDLDALSAAPAPAYAPDR